MHVEAMEVFLKDTLSGEQHAVHIEESDTPVRLKAKALDVVLGSPPDALPEDAELSVDGEVLDDSTPLCGAAGVSQGCCIDVALSGARFVEVLKGEWGKPRGSHTDINTIPAWARGLRDVALAAVRRDGNALQHLDKSFRTDRHIVTTALRSCGNAFQYASEDLRADEDVVLSVALIRSSLLAPSKALMHASPALLSNKTFVLTLVQHSDCGAPALQYVDAALKADREVVMAAVQRDPGALRYACEPLRNDRQLVMAACGGIGYASDALRNDKEVALRAIRIGRSQAVSVVSEALRGDREVMMAAVRRWGPDFRFASPALHDDMEFQREAVLWHGGVLDSLVVPGSDVPLNQDRDLVFAAVETHPAALARAHPSLQGDREVVLAAMHGRMGLFRALRYAHSHLKQDEEVVLAGVRRDPLVLKEADSSLRTNRDFVLRCVKLQGRALKGACPSVSSDSEVQLAAVAQDPSALQFCDESIRSNRDVVLTAVRKKGYALKYASDNLRKDREVVLASVKG